MHDARVRVFASVFKSPRSSRSAFLHFKHRDGIIVRGAVAYRRASQNDLRLIEKQSLARAGKIRRGGRRRSFREGIVRNSKKRDSTLPSLLSLSLFLFVWGIRNFENPWRGEKKERKKEAHSVHWVIRLATTANNFNPPDVCTFTQTGHH